MAEGSVVLRGLLFSIAPTLVAWLIVFPLRGHGPLGLNVRRADASSGYRAQRCLGNRRGAMGS